MSPRTGSGTEWRHLVDRAKAHFVLGRRLPAKVSLLQVSEEPFFDGDVIFGSRGWELASSLAVAHLDASVHVVALDPPADQFFGPTGEYPGFSCSSNADDHRYLAGLFGAPSRGGAGQIGHMAETIAIFGDTGRWGLWAERNVAGLVVGRSATVESWAASHAPFLGVEDAIEGFIGTNFGAPGSDPEFEFVLRRNYGSAQ